MNYSLVKLIPLTGFVELEEIFRRERGSKNTFAENSDALHRIFAYNMFLNTKLKKSHFIGEKAIFKGYSESSFKDRDQTFEVLKNFRDYINIFVCPDKSFSLTYSYEGYEESLQVKKVKDLLKIKGVDVEFTQFFNKWYDKKYIQNFTLNPNTDKEK